MKMILLALVSVTALSANAIGLESYYGKVSQHGRDYYCTYTNKTNKTLDMKYVAFDADRIHGDSHSEMIQTRIDRKVAPGKTITAGTEVSHIYTVNTCKFQAR